MLMEQGTAGGWGLLLVNIAAGRWGRPGPGTVRHTVACSVQGPWPGSLLWVLCRCSTMTAALSSSPAVASRAAAMQLHMHHMLHCACTRTASLQKLIHPHVPTV